MILPDTVKVLRLHFYFLDFRRKSSYITNMKYIVEVKEVHTLNVEVETSSKEHAIEMAKSKIASGDANMDCLEYSHTLDSDLWNVYLT